MSLPQPRRPLPSDLAQPQSDWSRYLDDLERALQDLELDLRAGEPVRMPTLDQPDEPAPLALAARCTEVNARLTEITERLTVRREEVREELAALPRNAPGADQRRFAAATLGGRVDLQG